MSRRPGLERALSVVRHRLTTHQIALRNTEALGWPMILTDHALETRAALAECEAIMEQLERDLERNPDG